MIEKDKNEPHPYGNKINLDKILFFFRTKQKNAVELNSREKAIFLSEQRVYQLLYLEIASDLGKNSGRAGLH